MKNARALQFCRAAGCELPADPDALERRLTCLLAEAEQAWPGLPADEDGFLVHFGAALGPDAARALPETLHAGDAYLAYWCSRGEPRAIEALEKDWLLPLGPALRRLEGQGLTADDALQLLRARLLISAERKPPRIAQYGGRGALRAWLKTAALRIALAARPKETPIGDSELSRLASPGRDPELDYIHARYRDAFRAAFTHALERLGKRQRSLLRFQVLDGLGLDQIGDVYKVHRSTVARWLAEAREQLLAHTRAALAERLALGDSELDGMFDLFASKLDVSITGFLRDE